MSQQNTKKVGLALGGGYARGMAHIGVIEILENEGIPIDFISGTSMGAVVGALYAAQRNISMIKKLATQMDIMGVTSLVDLSISRSGFMGGKRVTNFLHRLLGETEFKDLQIPFRCVATDIENGDEVVLQEGSVLDAVRASFSIPIIFSVTKKQDRYLVDGGLVNNVPVSVAKEMGADFIIAVDVTPDKAERAEHLKNHADSKQPSMFHIMVQSIYIATYLNGQIVSEGADSIIHPHMAHINPGDFHRGRECVLEGELTATDCIPEIKRKLAAVGISLRP
jgi:NTE family protein